MRFSEKLRQLRTTAGMTQRELAEALDTTIRTVQNYETGHCYPRRRDTLKKLAEVFSVTPEELISPEDEYIIEAEEKGGVAAGRDVNALLTNIGGLFAGGELSEDDKDKVMRTISELYWKAKENNRKYSKNK